MPSAEHAPHLTAGTIFISASYSSVVSVLFILATMASTADQRQASGPQGAADPCISLVERSAYHLTSAEAAEVLTQADVLRRFAQRPDIPELEATCRAYYDKLFRELGSDRFRTHLLAQGFTAQGGRADDMVKMYGAALTIRHKLKDGTELITRGVPLGLAIGVYIDEVNDQLSVKLTSETI